MEFRIKLAHGVEKATVRGECISMLDILTQPPLPRLWISGGQVICFIPQGPKQYLRGLTNSLKYLNSTLRKRISNHDLPSSTHPCPLLPLGVGETTAVAMSMRGSAGV